MPDLLFDVLGVPATQGSKNLWKGRMIESNKRLPAWRMGVMRAATMAMRECLWDTLDEPVGLSVTFYLKRPKVPRWWVPAVKPDTDKLLRAIGDALTQALVIRDDARITDTIAYKRYCTPDFPVPGARIRVYTLEDFSE